MTALLAAWIALLPVIARIGHPTLLGDDVQRVVELIKHPLGELLVRPFNEHLAPVFDFVSWLTWQAVGHDLRLTPLGFRVASVLPWVLLLVLLGGMVEAGDVFGLSRSNPTEIRSVTLRQKGIFPAATAAANLLGFTTQNPARIELATAGASPSRLFLGTDAIVHTRRPAAWRALSKIDAALFAFVFRTGQVIVQIGG